MTPSNMGHGRPRPRISVPVTTILDTQMKQPLQSTPIMQLGPPIRVGEFLYPENPMRSIESYRQRTDVRTP